MSATPSNTHREKLAYVYIRQSTMGQVRFHQESTQRQYALQEKALQLGWAKGDVVVLDNDLGQSGAQTANRHDFQRLMAEVSLHRVGAVLALEASRLSRSCADWHKLLELCAWSGTLIIDEDGTYDPRDFNDQLILGFKGTMSQAELHFIRARLLGGKRNKAKKGELRFPLPVGYTNDSEGGIVIDPNREVQHAVATLFDKFRERGTVYGVVRAFADEGLEFPKRAYGGTWQGQLIWGKLTHGRALKLLKNPSYAGCYVYGRYGTEKSVGKGGAIREKTVLKPIDQWEVTLRDHHPAYITWEDYLANCEAIKRNCTHGGDTALVGAAREGAALLQGLLICGDCGRRLTVRYGKYPQYECNWHRRNGITKRSCLSTRAEMLDERVSERMLEMVQPLQIEIAIEAARQLSETQKASAKQRELQLQRVSYEVELAERNYRAVDATNRLVAATLEQQWDRALEKLESLRREQRRAEEKEQAQIPSREQQGEVTKLSAELPRVWRAATTENRDRKRIARQLIKDITIGRKAGSRTLKVQIRWQGGACETIEHQPPPRSCDKWRYGSQVIERVRTLASDHHDEEIAEHLNREGVRPSKAERFTAKSIRWIRHKHQLPAYQPRRQNEVTVREATEHFEVSRHVIYYWMERGYVTSRQDLRTKHYYLTIGPEKERELRERIESSSRLPA